MCYMYGHCSEIIIKTMWCFFIVNPTLQEIVSIGYYIPLLHFLEMRNVLPREMFPMYKATKDGYKCCWLAGGGLFSLPSFGDCKYRLFIYIK